MLNQLRGQMDIASDQAAQDDLEMLADALNMLMAELFLIYFKTRNFHWHLSGPSLWDYDMLLENQSSDVISCMDQVAERLQSLGLPVLHPLEEVAQRRIKRGKAANRVDPVAMLRELLADKHDLVGRMRTAKTLASKLEDGITSALIGRWITNAEQHIWSLLKVL